MQVQTACDIGQAAEQRRTCMSMGLSGPLLSMLSARPSAFFRVVSNCSLHCVEQPKSFTFLRFAYLLCVNTAHISSMLYIHASSTQAAQSRLRDVIDMPCTGSVM